MFGVLNTVNLNRDEILELISDEVLLREGFAQRWQRLCSEMKGQGVDAINILALRTGIPQPVWFCSSLPQGTQSTYLSDNHLPNDFLIKHAATKGTLILWNTAKDKLKQINKMEQRFTELVVDSGYSFIASNCDHSPLNTHRHCISFCVSRDLNRFTQHQRTSELKDLSSLLIQWLGWPDQFDAPIFLPSIAKKLSPREGDILSFFAKGYLAQEIGHRLGISHSTVSKHVASAKNKLGAKSVAHAITIAIREKQISL